MDVCQSVMATKMLCNNHKISVAYKKHFISCSCTSAKVILFQARRNLGWLCSMCPMIGSGLEGQWLPGACFSHGDGSQRVHFIAKGM